MREIKTISFYENTLIVNRTHRFKDPQVIIRTWYGIKIISGGTFRFFCLDGEILQTLLKALNLNKRM